MKKGWEIKKLGDVCEFQNGFAFKSNSFKSKGSPILRISNIQDYGISNKNLVYFNKEDYNVNFEQFKVFPDEIIIAMSGGTTGKIGINNTNTTYYLNQRVGKFSPSIKINKVYLLYFLHSKTEESLKMAAGAAQPNLSTAQINNFLIPLPSVPEQERIVLILDKTFAKIDNIKKNAERNLENTKELFQSALEKNMQAKKNWTINELGDCSILVRGPFGGSLKKESFIEKGYAVYEQQHAIYNQFENIRYRIDEAKFKEMRRFELLPGDLIMSCSGTMGKSAIVPGNIEKGIINQALLKITPKNNINAFYLNYYINSEAFQHKLKQFSQGAAIKNVASVQILKSIQIAVPNIQEQQSIVQKLNKLSAKCKQLEANYKQEIDNCEEMKKTILTKAFNGEL